MRPFTLIQGCNVALYGHLPSDCVVLNDVQVDRYEVQLEVQLSCQWVLACIVSGESV